MDRLARFGGRDRLFQFTEPYGADVSLAINFTCVVEPSVADDQPKDSQGFEQAGTHPEEGLVDPYRTHALCRVNLCPKRSRGQRGESLN